MKRDLDILTFLLLDPCLTTSEAKREAGARTAIMSEARMKPKERVRKIRQTVHTPPTDGPVIGF